MGWDMRSGQSRKELINELIKEESRHPVMNCEIDSSGEYHKIVATTPKGYDMETKVLDFSYGRDEINDSGEQEWWLNVVKEYTTWKDGKQESEKHLLSYILKWFPPNPDAKKGLES